jgi:hypothetical protein
MSCKLFVRVCIPMLIKPKISKSKATPSSKKGMTVVLKMGNGNDEKSTIQ